jgi:hypothetical protein
MDEMQKAMNALGGVWQLLAAAEHGSPQDIARRIVAIRVDAHALMKKMGAVVQDLEKPA